LFIILDQERSVKDGQALSDEASRKNGSKGRREQGGREGGERDVREGEKGGRGRAAMSCGRERRRRRGL